MADVYVPESNLGRLVALYVSGQATWEQDLVPAVAPARRRQVRAGLGPDWAPGESLARRMRPV